MNSEEKQKEKASWFVLILCLATGAYAGKVFYDCVIPAGSPFSLTGFFLATFIGMVIFIVLMRINSVFALPVCPKCKSARLKIEHKVLDIEYHSGGFHYYGLMNPNVEIRKMKKIRRCRRCGYKDEMEYEERGES